MLDFFKNKKNYNPNEEVLGNLTPNQKKSVTNLLFLIARSDGEFNKKELDYLNTCFLGYSTIECTAYLDLGGHNQMFKDIMQLSSSQKDYVLFTAFELMNCDAKINEIEMNIFVGAFEKIGYTEDDIVNVINKTILLINKFK